LKKEDLVKLFPEWRAQIEKASSFIEAKRSERELEAERIDSEQQKNKSVQKKKQSEVRASTDCHG